MSEDKDFEAQLASIDADIKQIDNAIERLSTKKQKLLSKKQQIKRRLQICASEKLANQDWERSAPSSGTVNDNSVILPSQTWQLCKEMMRPVIKYLVSLDMEKYEDECEEEKTKKFSFYLLKIGIKISQILKSYKDPEKIKEWRRNLWVYVSTFTDHNEKILFKLYQQAKCEFLSSKVKKENYKMERKSILEKKNEACSDAQVYANYAESRLSTNDNDTESTGTHQAVPSSADDDCLIIDDDF